MKGVVSLIAVVLLAALGTTGFFGIIYSADTIQKTVNYQTGDFNTITEAKLKADAYENRTRVELNYSTNIRALELGLHGGEDRKDGNTDDLGWPESIPTYQKVKTEYLDAVTAHLRTQNDVIGCSTPGIENVDTYSSSKTRFEANLRWPRIRCETKATEATINITDTLQIHNPPNRYLKLGEYSVSFASRIPQYIKDRSPITATGYDEGSDCPESRSAEKSEARTKAIQEAEGSKENYAKKLFGDDSKKRPEWIVRKGSSRTFQAEIKGEVDVDSDSCTYPDPCGGKDEPECNDGTQYSADATAAVYRARLKYNLSDSKKKVINSKGEKERIDFNFEMIYSVPTK
ncbi:MAG: hypothetical protein ABEK16_03655 [Candidatus Nanohalobium sp.]